MDWRKTRDGVVKEFQRHGVLVYSSAMAYQLLSALVPLLLFALALAGALQLESLWTDHLAPWVKDGTSKAVYRVIDDSVRHILRDRQFFWLTIGLVLTVYSLSGFMRTTIRALDALYDSDRTRSTGAYIVRSLWLGALFGALVLGALVSFALLPVFAGLPLAVLLFGVAITLTLRFAPAEPRPAGWVSFGSALSTLTWLVCASAYGLYTSAISHPSSAFGPLAAAFVFVVFLYVSTTAFLLGVLIDAQVREEAMRK